MDRVTMLRSMLNPDGFGLEIGPSYSPLLPKAEGFNVETLDHADQDALIKKYRSNSQVDWTRIEKVDYVSDGRRITDIIGASQKYDYIVASHVIEHIPDVIGFLQDCEAVLKADGVLVLAVPDKRFCFDVLRPVSTVGQIIQAHLDKRTHHTPGQIFDHVLMVATREGKIVWSTSDTDLIGLMYPKEMAAEALQWAAESAGYNDAHAWQYTPSSFRMLVEMVSELGYVSLKEAQFIETGGFEFFISLSRLGQGCNVSHDELMRRTLQELRAINV
ncbi:MAG: type 11 methyltransferase [Methylocystaceae bacterium]|nr:MAG: type 11 [Methylocystaceae bacterium]TXT42400.1 MAG: type 11 methyltransferase [Methylocystaceae bacterium]